MKISSTFHVFTFLMVVLIVSMPFVAFAQQNSVQAEDKSVRVEDEAAAERDVEFRTNK